MGEIESKNFASTVFTIGNGKGPDIGHTVNSVAGDIILDNFETFCSRCITRRNFARASVSSPGIEPEDGLTIQCDASGGMADMYAIDQDSDTGVFTQIRRTLGVLCILTSSEWGKLRNDD